MIPRVLVATNMYPSETHLTHGVFVQVQVEALRELGVLVDVFHLHGGGRWLNYSGVVGSLRRKVRSCGADVVYAFYGLMGWIAVWQPAPVVLSLAGDDILGTPDGAGGKTLKSQIAVVLSQWAALRAAVVCVQSDEMRQKLWGARLRQRALVIPYGVDPAHFHPGDQAEARRRLHLPADELLVLFPNTPEVPRKRLDLAEAAISLVRRDLPNVGFRIVTRRPPGEMPDYYRAADCCLLTSDWEGSPNVVKEAFLCGLPVVTTDVGDVRRWVPLSPESAICERTPEALAREIYRVLIERRRVDPAPFLASLSSRVIAQQMLHLFDEAVNDSHRGRR
jgi:glycosyltransferase involved in cell wall biosynthesis